MDGEEQGAHDFVLKGSSLSVRGLFDALWEEERRELLRYLIANGDQSVPLSTIVAHLADGADASNKKIECSLHHIHIPKLTELGVIDYDFQRKELRYHQDDLLEKWARQIEERTE